MMRCDWQDSAAGACQQCEPARGTWHAPHGMPSDGTRFDVHKLRIGAAVMTVTCSRACGSLPIRPPRSMRFHIFRTHRYATLDPRSPVRRPPTKPRPTHQLLHRLSTERRVCSAYPRTPSAGPTVTAAHSKPAPPSRRCDVRDVVLCAACRHADACRVRFRRCAPR